MAEKSGQMEWGVEDWKPQMKNSCGETERVGERGEVFGVARI